MAPLKSHLLTCALLLSMAGAIAAQAAEPDMRLIIRRTPIVPVATNTAKAVPATQPAARLPVVSVRMTFLPGVPMESDFEINNLRVAITALFEVKNTGDYLARIKLSMTEYDRISDDPKSTASASAIEKVETSVYLRPGEEHMITQSSLSQWSIKIEKKNDPK